MHVHAEFSKKGIKLTQSNSEARYNVNSAGTPIGYIKVTSVSISHKRTKENGSWVEWRNLTPVPPTSQSTLD